MKLKGVLFDSDGTLIDTNELIMQSFEYALDTVLHTSMSRAALTQTFGIPLKQIMFNLAGERADALLQAFLDYSWHNEHLITLFPGVEETLQHLSAMQIPMAVVTSKLLPGIQRDFELFHIAHYFDCIMTPERTAQHKPHPEPALAALAQLQLQPQQAIMVGDSPYDITCGASAGCRTAAVTYSVIPQDRLLQSAPDYLIASLTELIPIIQNS